MIDGLRGAMSPIHVEDIENLVIGQVIVDTRKRLWTVEGKVSTDEEENVYEFRCVSDNSIIIGSEVFLYEIFWERFPV